MQLDEDVCLCFHVTRRKLENFLRVEQPVRPSQLSACQGAGTGCGWCRPFLERMFHEAQQDATIAAANLPEAEEYARDRAGYIRDGKGTPPT